MRNHFTNPLRKKTSWSTTRSNYSSTPLEYLHTLKKANAQSLSRNYSNWSSMDSMDFVFIFISLTVSIFLSERMQLFHRFWFFLRYLISWLSVLWVFDVGQVSLMKSATNLDAALLKRSLIFSVDPELVWVEFHCSNYSFASLRLLMPT